MLERLRGRSLHARRVLSVCICGGGSSSDESHATLFQQLKSILPQLSSLKACDLRGLRLKEGTLSSLLTALRNHASLTTLSLSTDNHLLRSAGATVADLLRANTRLRSLEVSRAASSGGARVRGRGDTTNPLQAAAVVKAIAAGANHSNALTSLNLCKHGLLTKEGGQCVGHLLRVVTTLRTLDVSDSGEGLRHRHKDSASFAAELTASLIAVLAQGSSCLTSLNVLGNKIPADQAELLVDMRRSRASRLTTLCGLSEKKPGTLDLRARKLGVGDAVLLACESVGGVTRLNLRRNELISNAGGKRAGAALGDLLISNTSLTALDLADNLAGSDTKSLPFVLEVARGLRANQALQTLNVMGNRIGKDQLSQLRVLKAAHPTLVSLCGIAKDATEANLSGLGMDANDAIAMANELASHRALAKVDASDNTMFGGGCTGASRALSGVLRTHPTLVTVNLANTNMHAHDAKIVAAGIRAGRVVTSLNLSSNELGAEGAQHLAVALPQCR